MSDRDEQFGDINAGGGEWGVPRSGLDANERWSRRFFDALREGGVWGVPRSGLTFTKRGDELVLTETMHPSETPVPREKWTEFAAYQEQDFEVIREEFGRAGITVRKLYVKEKQ